MIAVFIGFVLSELSLTASLFLLASLIWLFFANKYPFESLLSILLIRPMIETVGTKTILEINSFSINYNAVIALLLIVLGVSLIIKRKTYLKSAIGFWASFVFLGVSSLSLFWSLNFSASASELVRIFSIFSVYFIALSLIRDKKKLKKLNIVIIVSAIVPMIVALVQYFSRTGETIFGEFFIRTKGTFFYPNSLAFFSVFVIGMLLVRTLLVKERISRISCGLLIGLSLLVLLSTYTRGAWLGAILILGIYGLIKHKKVFFVGVIVLLVAYMFVPVIQERIGEIATLEPFSSLMWRFRLWGDAIGDFVKRPIWGYGIGTFETLSANSQDLNMLPAPEAHNDYLRIMIELGLIGLISYLAFIFRVLIFNFKTFLNTKDKFLKNINLISAIVFGVFVLMAFGDNVLRGTATQWALFAYLGGIVGLTQEKNKE